MLNLSIMNLDSDHVDEICEDIIAQQRDGVSTHAMFIMKFFPDSTPPVNKAEKQCAVYDMFREKLDRAGAKHGVLVQSTLGHIYDPVEMYPFTPVTQFIDGKKKISTVCPLDTGFQAYIKEQMKILAARKPSIIMIDDDAGILYRGSVKGCACPLHMAEFNRRAGTNMSREELYAHIKTNSEEGKRYTDIFVQLQKESLLLAVKAMREGIDEVDPSIQGVISGICPGTFYEFSDEIAKAFAGKGNPTIIRLNGGPYTKPVRCISELWYKVAVLIENVKGKVDVFLAETDTCPQNRYSTSAALMHGHFTASILEGATGAKHWITRLGSEVYEPASGIAYRKILKKYSGFYEKLTEYAKELKPFGCRMPVSLKQDYGFIPSEQGQFTSPWSTCFLERFGLPLYFGNKSGGAVFLDNISANKFNDDEIKEFFKGTLILSGGAAEKLNELGFIDYTGVKVSDWNGKKICGEIVNGKRMQIQWQSKHIEICRDGVKALSDVIYDNVKEGTKEVLFPGVTSFENPAGGETIVFAGHTDIALAYTTLFSMFNETRKKMFVDILSKRNHIPVYYPEDSEVYLRAGYLDNGEIMAAFINFSYDQLEDIPVAGNVPINRIEKLNPDGTRSECSFSIEDGIVRVSETLNTLMPVVLFIS